MKMMLELKLGSFHEGGVGKIELNFKPIRTRKKYEEIVVQIKQHIEEGYLKPGDKLPSERELEGSFGVSRASIREAFCALEMLGIVEVRSGEGSYVCLQHTDLMPGFIQGIAAADKATFPELLEVRKMIEVEATGYAAKRATDSDLALLEKELKLMIIHMNNPGRAWERSNYSFHFQITKASQNRITINLLEKIADYLEKQIRIFSLLPYADKYTPELLYQEHVDIYEAIMNRDSNKAREKMFKHLSGLEKVLLENANIA